MSCDSIRERRVYYRCDILMILQRQSMGNQGGAAAFADGVRMEDIIEGTVGALQILAREPNNRFVIRFDSALTFLVF